MKKKNGFELLLKRRKVNEWMSYTQHICLLCTYIFQLVCRSFVHRPNRLVRVSNSKIALNDCISCKHLIYKDLLCLEYKKRDLMINLWCFQSSSSSSSSVKLLMAFWWWFPLPFMHMKSASGKMCLSSHLSYSRFDLWIVFCALTEYIYHLLLNMYVCMCVCLSLSKIQRRITAHRTRINIFIMAAKAFL